MKRSVWVLEFDELAKLIHAIQWANSKGYSELEAYSPFASEELNEALGLLDHGTPAAVFLGGLFGALLAFFTQAYAMGISYPLDVGGRPLFSWPSFIPITFEICILGGALSGIATMLILNRLPRLNHPVFDVPGFERASKDRFFLCVSVENSSDLHGLGALKVTSL